MKSLIPIFAATLMVCTMGIAPAQTPPNTVDGYIGAAKAAAGTEWPGTFLRLCVPPPAGPQAGRGGRGGRGAGAAAARPGKVVRRAGQSGPVTLFPRY